MAESQETISEDVKRELQEAFSSGGVAQLTNLIQRKTNEWKKIPLNIAITGVSGVGKSSFINAIRGITADDEGGAHVDVVEATGDIKPYIHPKNSNMVLWDLPGVGTPRFPRSKYLKQVEIDKYDFFLILSSGRFREDDLWLGKEIRRRDKNFHYIRTHIDSEVTDDKKAHPKTHSKANVIEKIEKDCRKQLDDNDLSKASVFLIDNYTPLDFDFDRLSRALIDEAPDHKREAMILSWSVLTDGVIERKVKTLKKRTYFVSLVSAVGGAIPIPGVGAVIDGAILLKEVNFFKDQLELDAMTINELEICLNSDAVILLCIGLTITTLMTILTGAACIKNVQMALSIALPIVGSIAAAGISYGFTVGSLCYILDIFEYVSREIYKAKLNKCL